MSRLLLIGTVIGSQNLNLAIASLSSILEVFQLELRILKLKLCPHILSATPKEPTTIKILMSNIKNCQKKN